jgi:hypothetical protein
LKPYFKIGIILIVLFGIQLNGNNANAQKKDTIDNIVKSLNNYLLYRNHDTAYIDNYGNEVAVKLLAKNKFNYFTIRDRNNKSKIKYRPAFDLSLGAGMAYKYFALDLTFSLGLNKNSEFIDPIAFDFQGRLYSSKQFVSFTLQYYAGYKLSNSSGLSNEIKQSSTIRDDIRTINFGLQYLYAFNYTKFSLKAPFVFNEVQKKSAGSIIGGLSFGIFIMDADSSIVPPEVKSDFNPEMYLVDVNIMNAAISVGYMYSFIYKDFFLTLGLIPGINFNYGDYRPEGQSRVYKPFNVRFKFFTMNSIGYNGRRFFAGFQLLGDTDYLQLDHKLNLETGNGQIVFFVGYRFGKR